MRTWSEIRTLSTGMLEINPKYQRALDLEWVKNIAENFNPDLVGIIQVSCRRGHYYVFDGQHTIKALQLAFNNQDYPVTCKVYYGLTESDEAKLFYDFNQRKKKINSREIIKAQVAFGDDLTMDFLKCTKDAGFSIDPTRKTTCRYNISAIKKAQKCFILLGAETYSRMLEFIRETWNGETWSVSQKILSGMTMLFRVFDDELELKNFVKRMKGTTNTDIERESHIYYTLSMPYRYAFAIGKLHNRSGGKKCLKMAKLSFFEE